MYFLFMSKQRLELVSIPLPRNIVEQLRALARREAILRNQDVTWATLAREALEQKLRDPEAPGRRSR